MFAGTGVFIDQCKNPDLTGHVQTCTGACPGTSGIPRFTYPLRVWFS